MKIEKIQKLKTGKYKIIFEDGETLVTYDEVILKHQLLFKKEISHELFVTLNTDTSYYKVFDKTLKLIERKIRSKKEVIEFLKKNEVDEIDTKHILDDLEGKGWINDEKFCKAYISDKFYLSNYGPAKIYHELLKHQIDEKVIMTYLSELNQEDIYDHLFKMIQKKIKANHQYSRGILKQRILSYFFDQGYEKEMILSIFDELYEEDPSIVEKEAMKLRKRLSKKYEGKELDFQLVSKLYQKGFLKEEIDKIKEEN